MIAKVILGTMTNARKLVSIAERISCDVELCSCGGKTWRTYRFYREGRKGYAWRVFEICAGKRKRGNGRNASG